jgi:hypothetical protein
VFYTFGILIEIPTEGSIVALPGMSKCVYSYYFAKYSADKLATLGKDDKGRRQTKQDTQHRKLKR